MEPSNNPEFVRHDCTICLGVRNRCTLDVLVQLQCRHIFHVVCLKIACLNSGNKCAYCREEFSEHLGREIWFRYEVVMADLENVKYLCTQGYIIFRLRYLNPRLHQKVDYAPPLTIDELKSIICNKVTALKNLNKILKALGHDSMGAIAGEEEIREDPREINGPQGGLSIGQLIPEEDPDSTERTIVLPGDTFISPDIDNLHIILKRGSEEQSEEESNELQSTLTNDGIMKTQRVSIPGHRFLHPGLDKVHLIFNKF